MSATEAGPRLRVRLFGHVALEVDGEPFHLATPRRTLALLSYLLLNRGAAVQRDFLAFLLWPDDEEDSARQKLRANLHDLQKVLPPAPAGWIAAETDSLRWRPQADVEIDVESFERLATQGALHEAIELYRGDLVATLYDEWIDAPRERLRNLYLGYLDQLASAARRDRAFGRAIDYAQRILAIDPWREDVVRRIIAMRHESGDAAGALTEYQHFADRLRDEMGVEPMPETVAVREAILRSETPAVADTAAVPAAPVSAAPPVSLPLLGRQAELAQMDEAWQATSGGGGAVVFVVGEAGIGKSRLVQAFAQRAAEQGGRAVIGMTARPETIPYEPIAEALRAAAPMIAALRFAPAKIAALATLVPELRAKVPGLPEIPDLPPAGERARLFEAVLEVVEALSRQRPLAMCLEDVQAAGTATFELLEFLAARLGKARVLIAVTLRDDNPMPDRPMQTFRRACAERGNAREIALGKLKRTDLDGLAATFPEVTGETLDAWYDRSEGHPLYLSQIVQIDAAKGVAGSTLRELLAQRIDELSAGARTLGEIAALFGRTFPSRALGAVSGWSDAEVHATLDELLDRKLVREASGSGIFDFAFAHHLIAETLAEGAPHARDAERNRRIARALERTFPYEADELAATIAHHYNVAGEPTSAAPHLVIAAQRAVALGALDDAALLARRALECSPNERIHDLAKAVLDELP